MEKETFQSQSQSQAAQSSSDLHMQKSQNKSQDMKNRLKGDNSKSSLTSSCTFLYRRKTQPGKSIMMDLLSKRLKRLEEDHATKISQKSMQINSELNMEAVASTSRKHEQNCVYQSKLIIGLILMNDQYRPVKTLIS